MGNRVVCMILGLVGGVVGGVIGFYVFGWIYRQGFYGMIIPGAGIGLGAGLLARDRSMVRGIICGVAAVGLGLYTEWTYRPFRADPSFGYLVSHVHELELFTLIMILVGGLLGFWLGKDSSFVGGETAEKPSRPGRGPADPE